MDDEKKEKLEKELQFLKDSMESGIISQEEFNRGESRIQSQLSEKDVVEEKDSPEEQEDVAQEKNATDIVEEVSEEIEAEPVEEEKAEVAEEVSQKPESVEEEKTEEEPEVTEDRTEDTVEEVVEEEKEEVVEAVIAEEPAKEQVIEEEKDSTDSEEPVEEKAVEEPVVKEAEVVEEVTEDTKAGEEDVPLTEEHKSEPAYASKDSSERSSLGKYAFIVLVIAFGLFFLFKGNLFGDRSGSMDQPIELLAQSEIVTEPACYRDSDCSQDRMIGSCSDAATSDAACSFVEDSEVHLTIIDDPSCALCDSTRMEQTLREVFPNLVVNRLSFASDEGSALALRQQISLLPAYFIGEEVGNAAHFDLFSRALALVDGGYFVTPQASGASYFAGREPRAKTLTVFVTADVRDRTMRNVQPVVDLFKGDITFTERLVNANAQSLVDEFAISTYPTFVINNHVKFGGIHSPDSIKENYCLFNAVAGCSTTLTSQIS
jgi:chemotaxis protein histidine kinase CheA